MKDRRLTPKLRAKKSKLLLHALYPRTEQERQQFPRELKSLVCAVFDSFVQELVSLAKTRCVDVPVLGNGLVLSALANAHDLSRRLERRLERLSFSRRSRAATEWRTPARRFARGVELAREVLDAGCEVARATTWRGRTCVRSVNGKVAYALPYVDGCLLYTSPSPRDVEESRMPSSA